MVHYVLDYINEKFPDEDMTELVNVKLKEFTSKDTQIRDSRLFSLLIEKTKHRVQIDKEPLVDNMKHNYERTLIPRNYEEDINYYQRRINVEKVYKIINEIENV